MAKETITTTEELSLLVAVFAAAAYDTVAEYAKGLEDMEYAKGLEGLEDMEYDTFIIPENVDSGFEADEQDKLIKSLEEKYYITLAEGKEYSLACDCWLLTKDALVLIAANTPITPNR